MDMATNISPFIAEVDLRQEMVALFTGDEFVNKLRPFIYRKSRHNEDGTKIKCHCYNEISKEGMSDCPDCGGAGYLWDEEIVPGHMWLTRSIMPTTGSSYNNGISRIGRSIDSAWVLVIPYKLEAFEKDIIYLPAMNDEGSIRFPIRVEKSYYITEVLRVGFDMGRKDFTAIGLQTR